MTDIDHYINMCDLASWDYIQYPCPIKMLPDFVQLMLGTWQKIAMHPAEVAAIKRILGYCKAHAERVISAMVDSIPEDRSIYRFVLWMDCAGKLNFYHVGPVTNLTSGLLKDELDASFMSRRPCAALEFLAKDSICNICTLWPIAQDLGNGSLYPLSDGIKLFPEYMSISSILATDLPPIYPQVQGKITTVPDTLAPCEYRTFYQWSEEVGAETVDYLYTYSNTNPTMVHFIDWALDMIMDNRPEFGDMLRTVMTVLKVEMNSVN